MAFHAGLKLVRRFADERISVLMEKFIGNFSSDKRRRREALI